MQFRYHCSNIQWILYASSAPQRPARNPRIYSDTIDFEKQTSQAFKGRAENAQTDHEKSEKMMETTISNIHKSNANEASVKGVSHHHIESDKLNTASRHQSSTGDAHSDEKSVSEEPKTFYTTKVAPVLRVWKRICPFVECIQIGKIRLQQNQATDCELKR